MTTWNKDWTESQKAIAREARRRKYALSRLQGGKVYIRQAERAGLGPVEPEPLPDVATQTRVVLEDAIRKKLREET